MFFLAILGAMGGAVNRTGQMAVDHHEIAAANMDYATIHPRRYETIQLGNQIRKFKEQKSDARQSNILKLIATFFEVGIVSLQTS
jgi:hypothetical protein